MRRYSLPDINSTLLAHLASAGGAAQSLRFWQPELIPAVLAFHNAGEGGETSSILSAQRAADIILLRNDMSDFSKIRNLLAQQELQRFINYGKQTDHTAHSLHLYLLGIWLYDNVQSLRDAIAKIWKRPSKRLYSTEVDWFLFQWLFAALLQDIGYVFYNLQPVTLQYRRRMDSIYSWPWLRANLRRKPKISERAISEMKEVHNSFEKTFGEALPPSTHLLKEGEFDKVIERLAATPWVRSLHSSLRDCRNSFHAFDPNESQDEPTRLEKYAYEIARNGYDGKGLGKSCDHAIASGLLLFQYSSYWYWLMKELRNRDKIAYDEVVLVFTKAGLPISHDYDADNLLNYIIPACRSVAYHNLQPKVAIGKELLREITLEGDPITLLSILCDELQIWNRFAAGRQLLRNYVGYEKFALKASDISLQATGKGGIIVGGFFIGNKRSRARELEGKLDGRIIEWSKVAAILVRSDFLGRPVDVSSI